MQVKNTLTEKRGKSQLKAIMITHMRHGGIHKVIVAVIQIITEQPKL